MPFYGFKQNPKQQVESKVKAALIRSGRKDAVVKVEGRRMSDDECKAAGYVRGSYVTTLAIDGTVTNTTHNYDWRKSYKLLLAEFEASELGQSPAVQGLPKAG